jgi:hypothetical protein
MRIYIRSSELPQYLATLSDRLTRALENAEAASLADALAEAERLSAGAFTTKQLAALGHPYAARDLHPPQDAAIINRQSGRFASSWHIEPPTELRSPSPATGTWPASTADDLVGAIVNDDPNAGFLDEGTQAMIARPLTARVMEAIRDRRMARVKEAIRQALAGR